MRPAATYTRPEARRGMSTVSRGALAPRLTTHRPATSGFAAPGGSSANRTAPQNYWTPVSSFSSRGRPPRLVAPRGGDVRMPTANVWRTGAPADDLLFGGPTDASRRGGPSRRAFRTGGPANVFRFGGPTDGAGY